MFIKPQVNIRDMISVLDIFTAMMIGQAIKEGCSWLTEFLFNQGEVISFLFFVENAKQPTQLSTCTEKGFLDDRIIAIKKTDSKSKKYAFKNDHMNNSKNGGQRCGFCKKYYAQLCLNYFNTAFE